MATKWKTWSRSPWSKLVAWLLVLALVGSAAAAIWQTVTTLWNDEQGVDPVEALVDGNNWEEPVMYEQKGLTSALYMQFFVLKSRGNIRRGKALDEETLISRLIDMFVESPDAENAGQASLDDATRKELEELDSAIGKMVARWNLAQLAQHNIDDNGFGYGYYHEEMYVDEDGYITIEEANFRDWLEKNPYYYQRAKQDMIDSQLALWKEINQLRKETPFRYYVYNAETDITRTNISGSNHAPFSPVFVQWDKASETLLLSTSNAERQSDLTELSEGIYGLYGYQFSEDDLVNLPADSQLMVCMTNQEYQNMARKSNNIRDIMLRGIGIAAGCLLGTLLCLVYLMLVAGRGPQDDELHLCPFDRIWTEVQIVAVVMLGLGMIVMVVAESAKGDFPLYDMALRPHAQGIWVVGAVILAALTAAVLLSQTRRIKARRWLEGFISWITLRWVWTDVIGWLWKKIKAGFRWTVTQFGKGPLHVRVLLACIFLPLLCIFPPFAVLTAVLLTVWAVRVLGRFETVRKGAKRLRAGETNVRVSVQGGHELQELAEDLNGISAGMSTAVERAVKSERMKTELISNVSHDIKTPLTGIITYVDLLKKCDLNDEKAADYVNIIDQKSQRLKALTMDLIEAAKASSGAIPVEVTRLDLDALLRQAVGEADEKLAKNRLHLRITSKKTEVRADGRHLWRILDNLLTNCARYALPDSRVYIDVTSEGHMAVLTMKNISANELNIPADELMQRFTRGDASRSTEGSGLGLSIAANLAKVMSGDFAIAIDGDLFKAEVKIPLWSEE